jgi:hypothetical protein
VNEPLVSIVIVSYNTKKLLQECLVSIYKHTPLKLFEIIVVDNASQDSSSQMVEKNFPKVKLIKNQKNLGFGQANNQALKIAQGKYFLFLNSDTKLTEDSIDIIHRYLKRHPETAIVGCKLKNPDGSPQQSAGFFPTLPRILFWAFFLDDLPLLRNLIKPYQISYKKFYETKHEVDWITGAFFLIKRSIFKNLGGFDKNLFMYGEEVDFCYRAKKNGFKVLYSPKTSIFHHKFASSTPPQAILFEFEFLLYFFKRYKSPWQLSILKILLKMACLTRIFLFGIIMGNKQAKIAYEKTLKLVR